MNYIGKPERATQNRIINLFKDELDYDYVGDWQERADNSNIEIDLLIQYLTKSGYSADQIARALQVLQTEANNPNRSLYDNNKAVYGRLRFGIEVKTDPSKDTERVWPINWHEPLMNNFAIAEEVTLRGNSERRPDLVLYVNGLAVGVIELKNSRVSIGDGIRQNISNQSSEFNEWFFSTVQLLFAGSDSEGLKYGTVGTPEKYYLQWKEDEEDNVDYKLDKYLKKMCAKKRLIEIMHDFVLFDGGLKKVPRVHQYFGIKKAQEYAERREGGIIWHAQGSGKSIVMVLLAKWILENNPNARVLIITDRDALDKQIKDVFIDAGETIYRTSSGRDLMQQLRQAKPRLLCSLIHKFGRRDVDDFEQFIKDLREGPSQAEGELFVFVDECHRTQSGKKGGMDGGKLHRAMKAMMPNAVFVGFTGTPLLKKDKQTTQEMFGSYIHTYKWNEAVEDKVVLDFDYDARDIDQRLGSEEAVDDWFDARTSGLNNWQKAALREQWGTLQKVLSSSSRMDRIIKDIVVDFGTKPRLKNSRGNAILVASSIFEACKYFDLFQKTPFRGKVGLVTSYNPNTQHVTTEDTGANTESDKEYIYNTYTDLLKDIEKKPGMSRTESYEEDVKELFKKQPANMKLLVVVDKLLTGFDAPSCTYLYIDKSMQDHGLFQAICRTNRLDGDDKQLGYIVDYKDLFKKVGDAISVYSSELDSEGEDSSILIKNRLGKGRERLEAALEGIALLCEPVEPPKGELQYMHYFCGNPEVTQDLADSEPQRAALYKVTAALVRAFANIADELEAAGFSPGDKERIKKEVKRYVKLRETIRMNSGETIDLKAYEADMRFLIDTYIEADAPRRISNFDDMTLLELIVKSGIADAINEMPEGIRGNKEAVAETIENNVRSKIIKDHLNDPAFYDKMSTLLDEVIATRKAKADEYEQYLQDIAELAKKVEVGRDDDTPDELNTPGKRALFNNLFRGADVDGVAGVAEEPADYDLTDQESVLALTLSIDEAVRRVRPNAWRGNGPKENVIKQAIYEILDDEDEVERIFPVIRQQKEY